MQEPTNLTLAFLAVQTFPDTSARGGILITNIETIPQEFRVTTPVKPTAVQRLLYGAVLDEYLNTQLVALPMFNSLMQPPQLILIKDKALLSFRELVTTPVVLAQRDESGATSNITFSSHVKHPDDANWARGALQSLIARRDLFEPFERLRTALAEIHKQQPETK